MSLGNCNSRYVSIKKILKLPSRLQQQQQQWPKSSLLLPSRELRLCHHFKPLNSPSTLHFELRNHILLNKVNSKNHTTRVCCVTCLFINNEYGLDAVNVFIIDCLIDLFWIADYQCLGYYTELFTGSPWRWTLWVWCAP